MANEKSVFKYLVCDCGYKKVDTTGKASVKCKNCGSSMSLSANWYARITHHGKTSVKAISPRKRDAEDYIASCKVAKREGRLLPGQENDITWSAAVENCKKWWSQDVAANTIRQSTVDFYHYMLIPLSEEFGGSSLLNISKERVGDYISRRQTQVSLTTVCRELSTLKRVYSMHSERLEMEERPKLLAKSIIMGKIKPPQADNEIERFCEVEEVQRVFSSIEGNKKSKQLDRKRTRLGILLGVGLGMRPANVCQLEWKEIDFKAGVICIPKAKMKNGKDYVTGLPDTIKEELQAWRKEQRVLSPYVFPSPKDPRKPVGNMRTAINRAIREASLNPAGVDRQHKVTPYVLTRHTFASQALMESGDVKSVSDQLHHSDMRVTTKRYAKVNVGHKKEKIEAYDSAVLQRMIQSREVTC